MIIESAEGSYETLVKLPDDDVGERWLVRAADGGFATLVRLGASRAAIPSDRNSFVVRIIAATRATSPRVRVPIDRGEFEGRPFAVYPYRFDVSLKLLIARLHARGLRLGVAPSVALAVALAEALDSVHDTPDGSGDPMRLVHGALRTERVRIAFAADVELDGLGLASPPGARGASEVDGARYAAPETLSAGIVDTRADVYSIAAVLFELLSARRFDRAHLVHGLGALVADAEPALVALLETSLSESPDDRPPSLDDFAASLRDAVPDAAAVELRKFALLATTIIPADVARAPFASDPAVAAQLERDRPIDDPSVVGAFSRRLLPGTPAEFVDPSAPRSVFGAVAPKEGLTGRSNPPRVQLKKVVSATPNPVAAPPTPGSANTRDKVRPSTPPPRVAKSNPPPANKAQSLTPSKKPSVPPPIPRPATSSSNMAPPAIGSALPFGDGAGQPTIPGGFGAPVVPADRSPWVKQGAPIPTSEVARRSAPPPPPPSVRSSAPPPGPTSVVPPPPASLLAAVADSPFAPIPPVDVLAEPSGAGALDGLFASEDDATAFGARPIDLASVAPQSIRPTSPPTSRPVDASIPLRPDDEASSSTAKKLIVASLALLGFVAVAAGIYVFALRDEAAVASTSPGLAPQPVGEVAGEPASVDVADSEPTQAPAPVAAPVEDRDAGTGSDAVDAATESEMVFEEPAPEPTATMAQPQRRPPRMVAEEDLSFRERRALRRARRRD